MIANKIANEVAESYGGKITKVPRSSLQNNSETVTNEDDIKIPKERHISRRKKENY